MTSLKICCIQHNIIWENPEANTSAIESLLLKNAGADLYVLPETFSTGFSIRKEMAESMEGKTVQWMQNTAQKMKTAIMGSIIIEANGSLHNRMLLAEENGNIQFYDKLHLFNYGSEGKCFTAGNTVSLFSYKGWKIKPIICYDLRFPVSIRNTEDYDLLICVANWPETRIDAWDTLLKARAIENQSYVIGVNRIGKDGNNLDYCGHTCVFDPMGKPMEQEMQTNIFTAEIKREEVLQIRKKFPFLEDRDGFKLL